MRKDVGGSILRKIQYFTVAFKCWSTLTGDNSFEYRIILARNLREN